MEPVIIEGIEEITDKLLSEDWKRRKVIIAKHLKACYYKTFMDKACNWLKDNIMMYVHTVGNDAYIDKDKLLQNFRNLIKDETTSRYL